MNLIPANIKNLILDMDGVLWKDSLQIGNLSKIFSKIQDSGFGIIMATNNSTQTPDQFTAKLKDFGVTIEPWQVVTSSQAVVELMLDALPPGAPVFAIGEKGLQDAILSAGFKLSTVDQAEKAEALVMGIDREINFRKVMEGTLLVRGGKPFFATNTDLTFPTPRGLIPGAGSWISVIVSATNVEPINAGKPAPYLFELGMKRLHASRENTLVVGDRLETDIAGGQAIGCMTALILSGVSSLAQAQAWRPRVDVIARDLAELVGVSPE